MMGPVMNRADGDGGGGSLNDLPGTISGDRSAWRCGRTPSREYLTGRCVARLLAISCIRAQNGNASQGLISPCLSSISEGHPGRRARQTFSTLVDGRVQSSSNGIANHSAQDPVACRNASA